MNEMIQPGEGIISALRALYDRYGYSRYKMNKFEEYDLYARNKDFLISEGVITFTDTNGKLMALKPDVTLSIVKNTRDVPDTVQKLYYNENVYRVSKGTRSFREIMQVGLEAIGAIDSYCIYEVLMLAAGSLACTEKKCILEISHLGILSDIISYAGIPADIRADVLHCIGEKNQHELQLLCRSAGISDENTELLCRITSLYGTPEEVLPQLETMLSDIVSQNLLSEFVEIVTALNKSSFSDMLRIDFSVVNDLRYYNGFVFKGFAEGIPHSVLSGGQYDTLMKKMHRCSGAIGFAVYLDMLEQFSRSTSEYDVDVLVVYSGACDISAVAEYTDRITADSESVLVQRSVPQDIKYKRFVRIINGEVITDENA